MIFRSNIREIAVTDTDYCDNAMKKNHFMVFHSIFMRMYNPFFYVMNITVFCGLAPCSMGIFFI
ncbi:hypothetical protein AYY16_10670 [Morganella psychrotolerans]|nr:hypothetical protein AYY16_10670 [Morganella psychrotolerans]